jgi:hypothetical protein
MFPLLPLIVGVVLPALPAEGGTTTIISGTYTRMDKDQGTSVRIIGRHDPGSGGGNPFTGNPLGPCNYQTAEVVEVIFQERPPNNASSDLFPFVDGSPLSLPLLPPPDSALGTCIYELPGNSLLPWMTLRLDQHGGNKFNFRLNATNGGYFIEDGRGVPLPCDPNPPANFPVILRTHFILKDPVAGSPPTIEVGPAM